MRHLEHNFQVVDTTHTPREWDSWRTVLHELHIFQERSLPDIQQYMKKENNFPAESHQYKLRFKKWGFRKNYTAPEKQAWAQDLQSGVVTEEVLVHDKPLKVDRIVRHVRKQARSIVRSSHVRKFAQSTSSVTDECSQSLHAEPFVARYSTPLFASLIEVEPDSDTVLCLSDLPMDVSAPLGEPQPWFPMSEDEICLHLLALEISMHTARKALRPSFWTLMEVKLFNGLRLLIQGDLKGANRSFNWACKEAAAHMEANPASFMISLVLTQSPIWDLYPMTHRRLFATLLETSLSKLGPEHSLSKFLEYAMDPSLVHQTFCSARRYVEVFLSNTFANESCDDMAKLQVFLPHRLIQTQDGPTSELLESSHHKDLSRELKFNVVGKLDIDFDEVVEQLQVRTGLDPWAHFSSNFFTNLSACQGYGLSGETWGRGRTVAYIDGLEIVWPFTEQRESMPGEPYPQNLMRNRIPNSDRDPDPDQIRNGYRYRDQRGQLTEYFTPTGNLKLYRSR